MSTQFTSAKQLAVYYRKQFPRMKMYADGRVNLGNGAGAIRWHQFISEQYQTMLAQIDLELLKDKDTHDNIFKELRKLFDFEASKQADNNLERFIPLIDFYDSHKRTLINKDTGRPSAMDIETYKTLNRGAVIYTPGVIVFDPYGEDKISEETLEGFSVTRVNLYSRPPWQQKVVHISEEEQKKLTLPAIVKDYFDHFVPDPECRDFVLDWMHYCLTSRCETYLVLNGAKGAGKGAFFEAIMQPLMGKQYTDIAPESALISHFNAFLEGKRLVLLDEVKFNTPEKLSKLKRYINADQTIEKKGVDSNKVTPTFNSFVINNNDEGDAHIEWDDRRFSVIDITKVKLESVWSKEKIEHLYSLTDAEIEQMGNYIFYRVPVVMKTEFSYWQGPHFWHLCYTSLAEWAKVIVDLVTGRTQSSYSLLDIRREYKKRTDNAKMFPRPVKIENFLKNYKHQGEYYLGELKGDAKDFEIIPSEHYRVAMIEHNEGHDAL